jgi:rSAM/selenodomain-associated transferase 1
VSQPKCGLGVMARAPSAGKTRLAAHLSPARLEALRSALLADTLEVVARARADGDEAVVFFTPAGAEAEMSILAPSFAQVAQADGDLGHRMRAAFEDLLGRRHCDVALLVGSDIPFLDPGTLTEARDLLRLHGGVVLGAADDGGYYLVGMSRVHAELFERIEWSTATVLADTLRAAERLGIDARLVRGAYDIDTIEDLRRLEREIPSAPDARAPRLRRWFIDGR